MSFIVTLTGPTTSGKTTLLREMQKENPDIIELISHTTRAPRKGEVTGKDYYFVSVEEFEQVKFVEKVFFNGNHYGISESEVMNASSNPNKIPVIIMEPNGIREFEHFCNHNGSEHITVFKVFLNVSMETVAQRILDRNKQSMDAAYSAKRMVSLFRDELPHWEKTFEWDLVINEYDEANKNVVPTYLNKLLTAIKFAHNNHLIQTIKGTIDESLEVQKLKASFSRH